MVTDNASSLHRDQVLPRPLVAAEPELLPERGLRFDIYAPPAGIRS